ESLKLALLPPMRRLDRATTRWIFCAASCVETVSIGSLERAMARAQRRPQVTAAGKRHIVGSVLWRTTIGDSCNRSARPARTCSMEAPVDSRHERGASLESGCLPRPHRPPGPGRLTRAGRALPAVGVEAGSRTQVSIHPGRRPRPGSLPQVVLAA